MWEITAKFRYCEATILHNEFPHKLRKVVRNDGWPDTALLIMHMLSTCCKLSAPATHHLLAHDVRPIDLAQLRMNFDRRYAVCIQNFYHRPHFTVCVSWNKRRHLQPLKRCYMRTLEVSLLHASCYIITLSRTRTRFKQLIVYQQWNEKKTCFVDAPRNFIRYKMAQKRTHGFELGSRSGGSAVGNLLFSRLESPVSVAMAEWTVQVMLPCYGIFFGHNLTL